MSKKEKATDLWVYELLKEANINLDAQDIFWDNATKQVTIIRTISR